MSSTDEILHDLNEAYAAEERAIMERELEEQADAPGMSKHTALPWIVTKAFKPHTLSVRGGVGLHWPIGGHTVCEFKEMRSGAKRGETREQLGFNPQDEADAELIVRAVNSYADLLAALKSILEIGKRDLSNPKYDGYFQSAREAIAKAEGKAQ